MSYSIYSSEHSLLAKKTKCHATTDYALQVARGCYGDSSVLIQVSRSTVLCLYCVCSVCCCVQFKMDDPCRSSDIHEDEAEEGQGDGAHALVHLPGRKERVCVVCADNPAVKRKRSLYWCPSCNCGVHPTCFHKLKHYHRPTHKGRKRMAESDSD